MPWTTRPPSPPIHEAVAAQARSRPNAVALIHRDEHVSYAALDAAADSYATDLWSNGVRPGHRVPVLLPRTPRLIMVLLGILKCGAAYAAMDRRWPPARVAYLATTLRAPLMVSDVDVTGSPASWTPADPMPGRVGARHGRPPSVPVSGTDPAAIFFTSGSTGVPKGVLSPHRATTRLFGGGGFADLGPGRVVLQAAPPSWDAFSLEVWGPLTSGGSCVLAETDHLLPAELVRLTSRAGLDTVWLTSSLLNFLIDEDDPGRSCLTGLRHVITGGERLSPTHVARFLLRHPGCRLTNGYGPVESCVFATTHRITAADCDRPDGIPLGRPVPGTTVHILDGDESVGAGGVGEICLAGDGLALGYLDDDHATSAAFPYLTIDGVPQRVYRTGDLGCLDSDGLLHFRGRADLQIKISGHRIEPAEVENAARRLPGVRDAAVLPVPAEVTGYDRLALFYVTDGAVATSPAVIRQALADALPPHLVPHVLRARDELPTTMTGKIDRAVLLRSL